MNIKNRHMKYALQRSLWWLPLAVIPFLFLLQYLRGENNEWYIFLLALSPVILIWLGTFIYWLWRTQK